ncbi:MAG: hypothetical protein NTX63_01365 [Candidatus Peregrinibacteria bacterium]|nr:hypothetical protein [Candidatus Peregrinibacteria bacterium]
MSLLFLLHSLNQPSRLTSPQFTRKSLGRQLLSLVLAPVMEPVRQQIRRSAVARGRGTDSCHFQLRAL